MGISTIHSFLDEATKDERNSQIVTETQRQTAELDTEQRLQARHKLLREVATGEAPRNAEELHQCIRALFGVSLPTTAVSGIENNISPFEAVYRVFFKHWAKSLWWAGRDSGKTFSLTLSHSLLGTFRPGHEGLHSGGVMQQAGVATETLSKFAMRPGLDAAFKNTTARTAWFNNGSSFKILPGKYKSVDGQHPNTFSADEIKHWDIKSLNQTWGIPSDKNSNGNTLIFASTNQDAGGGFNYILDEAPKRNVNVAVWTVFETMRPCVRCLAIDSEPHGTDESREKVCALWRVCKGEKARKATGWKSREEVAEFVISLGGADTPEARTQAFCMEPSTKGLVLYNFAHRLRKDDGNWTTMTYDYEGTLPFYISFDPAEANKSAMSFWHYYDRESYMFDELIIEDCPDDTFAKMRLFEYLSEKNYRDPNAIIVDPRKTDAIYRMRQGTPKGEGLGRFYNAVGCAIDEASGGQEVVNGLKELRNEICDGAFQRWLFINPDTCPGHITAVKNAFYKTLATGDISSKATQKEAYKDEIDEMRYWVRFLRTVLKRGGSGVRVIGG